MSGVPSRIVILNDTSLPAQTLTRLPSQESKAEQFYDELICNNLPTIADALRSAGLLEEDSELRLLARQYKRGSTRIDILLAETDGRSSRSVAGGAPASPSDAEFRRLILVETKLLRNRESKRKVLGQILDYAEAISDDSAEGLGEEISTADAETGAWIGLPENMRALHDVLRNRDFLLLVAGDYVDQSLVQLSERYLSNPGQLKATSMVELGFLALAIYTSPSEQSTNPALRVFVPHVVGAITRGERHITVKVDVRVRDAGDRPLDVEPQVPLVLFGAGATDEGVSQKRALRACIDEFGPEAAAAYSRVLETAQAKVSLEVVSTDSGKPTWFLTDVGALKRVPVLRLRSNEPAMRDCLHEYYRVLNSPSTAPAANALRAFLKSLPDAEPSKSGMVEVSLAALDAHRDALSAELAKLAAALKTYVP